MQKAGQQTFKEIFTKFTRPGATMTREELGAAVGVPGGAAGRMQRGNGTFSDSITEVPFIEVLYDGPALAPECRAELETQFKERLHKPVVEAAETFVESTNPITKEWTTTLFAIGTGLYIAKTQMDPVSNAAIWGPNGDLNIPIFSTAVANIWRGFSRNIRPLPGVDAYAGWSDEDKENRANAYAEVGAFDGYWKDQDDTFDRVRLMSALTEKALLEEYHTTRMHPHLDKATIEELHWIRDQQSDAYLVPKLDFNGTILQPRYREFFAGAIKAYESRPIASYAFQSVTRPNTFYKEDEHFVALMKSAL